MPVLQDKGSARCSCFEDGVPEICPAFKVTDDEQHRLNHCVQFRKTNLCDCAEKVNFDDVYKSDISIVRKC